MIHGMLCMAALSAGNALSISDGEEGVEESVGAGSTATDAGRPADSPATDENGEDLTGSDPKPEATETTDDADDTAE